MTITTIRELVPVLQTSIGPVILISGLGLLLLTMTNRLSRIIDRSRELLDESEKLFGVDRARIDREIDVLWRRARYVRSAILLAVASCLGAATLIILIFLTTLCKIDVPLLVATVFILSMISLIASLVLFLFDVNLTLSALRIELEGHRKKS
jgi:ABC-type microcin C transport system permease subunit YejB